MRFGKRISGRLVAVPPESLRLTQPGEVYEFTFYTEHPFDNDEAVAQQLLTLEDQVADLQVTYIETFPDRQAVTLQIMDIGPGSISLAGLLSLIPAIFVLVGIVVVGYMTWQTLQTAPWLLWLGLLAGAGVIFYYFIGKETIFKPTKVYERPKKDDTSVRLERSQKLQRLTRLRVGYENKINRDQSKIDSLKSERERLQKTRKKSKDKPSIDKKIDRIADKIGKLEDSQEVTETRLDSVMGDIRAQ